MPRHSIYALCEPDTREVRYVGKTSFPLGHRLSNHVASAKRGMSSQGLSLWVNRLEANGRRPIIVLLEECAPEDADKTEIAWIARCQQQGYALLNVVHVARPPRMPKARRQGQLTPGNVRMIGVPVALHERLKAEAKREHATIYEVIEDALEARQRLAAITAAINPQSIAQQEPA